MPDVSGLEAAGEVVAPPDPKSNRFSPKFVLP